MNLDLDLPAEWIREKAAQTGMPFEQVEAVLARMFQNLRVRMAAEGHTEWATISDREIVRFLEEFGEKLRESGLSYDSLKYVE